MRDEETQEFIEAFKRDPVAVVCQWFCGVLILAGIVFAIVLASGCSTTRPPVPGPGTADPRTSTLCETEPATLPARNGHKQFRYPLEGFFAEESHGLTVDHQISDGIDGWPDSRSIGMTAHLDMHAKVLEKYGLKVDEVYDFTLTRMKDKGGVYRELPYRRVWTGMNEKGQFAGMWSRKDKPTIEAETWTFNQAWTFDSAKTWYKRRFLLCAKGRCVVAIAHENGPSDTKWMGGVQPAIAHYLDVKNTEKIRVSWLVDQTLPLGPVLCQ
jgi:hypothetical protein